MLIIDCATFYPSGLPRLGFLLRTNNAGVGSLNDRVLTCLAELDNSSPVYALVRPIL